MKIEAVRTYPLAVALPEGTAYGMAKSLATARQSMLVRLILENGVEGWGEAWGLPAANQAFMPLLEAAIVGQHVLDVEQRFALLLARNYHLGIQGPLMACISGVDIAAKDAAGKWLGVPVHRLLGGKRWDRVPVYGSGGYMTEDPVRDFPGQLDAFADAGFASVKFKIGLSPASDEARVKMARERLGPDVELLVDINTNYTYDLARESIARIAPYRVGWIEEPLMPQDIAGYEMLHRWSPVPIATGEALYTAWDFKRLLERRAADVLQPDLTLCGGFWQGRAIATLAALEHVRISPHVWGSGVGLAASVHYTASLPSFPHGSNVPKPPLVEYDVGHNPLREGILRRPLLANDGFIAVSDAPGLGIEIDHDALERFALRPAP